MHHTHLQLCLIDGIQADIAVAVIAGGIGLGQAVLQNFDIQVAVGLVFGWLIPYPDQISVPCGILVPIGGIGFENDGNGAFQLFSGESSGTLSVFFDFSGTFRGIDSQVACLENAVFNNCFRHMEVGGIPIHIGFYRDFLFGRLGGKIQGNFPGIVHRFPFCQDRDKPCQAKKDGQKKTQFTLHFFHESTDYQPMEYSHSAMASAKAASISASTSAVSGMLKHLVSRGPTWLRAVEEPLKAGEV